ncbi:hypothetical protein BYT27DRAFT_7160154 [Phlegmacium glaucopus]|nr:hypothetical protein BYT27DRAFT_7160154 [Phlegmacium glaucopus]
MKYIALLSGGKDSCYNLVHCAQNGHELVAAASLGPEPGKEELDSYLYQTVGQDAIELVARALEVPLYRRVITGQAIEQGSEYGGRNAKDVDAVAGDETEDLFELLSTIKSHHPDIRGVSVGAILSNYQRVRVEHVCRRLSLTPLCYLWQRNQQELLSEMIEAGMDAILIKVAGIGLTTAHLGKSLVQMEPTLLKLNTMYGSHICGEGGEYESLTLDCPLFKHRLVLNKVETVIHSDNSFATVAFLRIKNAALESKLAEPLSAPIPPLLTGRYKAVRDAILSSQGESKTTERPLADQAIISNHSSTATIVTSSLQRNNWVAVSNVQANSFPTECDTTLEEEVTKCFQILTERLNEYDLDLSNCVNINLFIRSMDLFGRVNAVYSTFFGSSPPARACVGVDLPENVGVRLDCIAIKGQNSSDRQSLHVQGLSYWAPANIGPYSQAITASEHVFISGQIGLIPSELIIPSPRSFSAEFALASQHVARVTSALQENSGGGWDGHSQLTVYWLVDSNDLTPSKIGHQALQDPNSPTLFLVIKELPKNAVVEKQVLLHTGRCLVDDDGGMTLQQRIPSFEQGDSLFDDGSVVHWEISKFHDCFSTSSCAIIFLKGDFSNKMTEIQNVIASLSSIVACILSMRYFYSQSATNPLDIGSLVFGKELLPPTTPIPCRFISSLGADTWDVALCLISV